MKLHETGINERFAQLPDLLRMSKSDLAVELNMFKQRVSEISLGRYNVTSKAIYMIAKRFPELSLRWLVTGDGIPFNTENTSWYLNPV